MVGLQDLAPGWPVHRVGAGVGELIDDAELPVRDRARVPIRADEIMR